MENHSASLELEREGRWEIPLVETQVPVPELPARTRTLPELAGRIASMFVPSLKGRQSRAPREAG
jgi:hypothetical protein